MRKLVSFGLLNYKSKENDEKGKRGGVEHDPPFLTCEFWFVDM